MPLFSWFSHKDLHNNNNIHKPEKPISLENKSMWPIARVRYLPSAVNVDKPEIIDEVIDRNIITK